MSGINESKLDGNDKNNERLYSRQKFIRALGLGTSATLLQKSLFAAYGNGNAKKKPNILFIAVDDLRPQLGCYGHTQMISPNIDRLAAQSVVFTRSFCNIPVCGASRASVLSGVRPTRNRFIDWYSRVDEDLPGALTLPKHLKQNGYYTASIGKVYHDSDDDITSWNEAPFRLEESRYLTKENIEIFKSLSDL